ncbi:DUF3781 domain-containing protein [Tenacibaculum maritimum]|nr:DUF3781 domain-containing protein [Tenacibaculum maritimum]
METIKHKILKNHCYTELVYQRINKKLGIAFSKFEIETLIQKVLEDTALDDYEKIGKNFYITNKNIILLLQLILVLLELLPLIK